jgi:hypothetical protein
MGWMWAAEVKTERKRKHQRSRWRLGPEREGDRQSGRPNGHEPRVVRYL